MRSKDLVIVVIAFLMLSGCSTTKANLDGLAFKEQLKVLFPKAIISNVRIDSHFTEAYRLIIKQPLDHDDPKAGTFEHYIYVSHTAHEAPTVLVTEGYSARHRTYELSRILGSNQVMVEYRFYGNSRPDPIPWEYLTNDQAIADYHSIVSKLKKLYKGSWISTGISKGGETVLIYKSKYPKDIDVAVPYVAPLIDSLEDPRTNDLINSVGSEACRGKIRAFQRAILQNRGAVLRQLRTYAAERKMKFTNVPIEEALEYSVLEFPFSFWQWGGNCEDVPHKDANPVTLWEYLLKISGVTLYNDQGFNRYLPSFYQHMIELGYYGFDLEPVKDLLVHVKSSSNRRFAPSNVDLTYDPNYIKEVRDYVENKGDKILYIYGGYDPWGACAPEPKSTVDHLMMVLEGGDHSTRIKDFSPDDKRKIYAKLKEWLGNITLNPI